MALHQTSDLSGFSATYAAPSGLTDSRFTGSIGIILSTGLTQQVSEALTTAIKCINFMGNNKLYSLNLDDNITIGTTY